VDNFRYVFGLRQLRASEPPHETMIPQSLPRTLVRGGNRFFRKRSSSNKKPDHDPDST
jgi:hypothetical protein